MENNVIKISNFKLNVFRKLLEQSLLVDNQLMLEISDEMIKACSFSPTKSFMKLWTVPISNLIVKPETTGEVLSLDDDEAFSLKFDTFNFYILKGDLFHKYISVHKSDMVELEFNVQEKDGKFQASTLKISSLTENNSPLITSFVLTTEDMISNKIDDYSQLLKECAPVDMNEFVLTDKQMQEVKRLIKNLHKAIPDNTAYLTFTLDNEKNKIIINDKVFTIDFASESETIQEKIVFNILKSDFIMTGNHTFSIFVNGKDQKVIFAGKYANSIIWGLSTKVVESSMNFDSSIMDATIDSLDIEEYLN